MLDEVVCAIKKLRNGHASGPDGISPELLQCAVGPVSLALHTLFSVIQFLMECRSTRHIQFLTVRIVIFHLFALFL